MRYQGGKAKTANKIAETIFNLCEPTSFYEPFMGGGWVSSSIAKLDYFKELYLSDIQPDLMCLWKKALNGYKPPTHMLKDEYDLLRSQIDPSALRGWAAFAASHSGKYFGGYGATTKDGSRNYLEEASRSFNIKVQNLQVYNNTKDLYLSTCSYESICPKTNSVIYCDPPYADTTVYSANKVSQFDSQNFWHQMNKWVKEGHKVFVSEFNAPPEWNSLWSVEHKSTLDPNTSKTNTEYLFTR